MNLQNIDRGRPPVSLHNKTFILCLEIPRVFFLEIRLLLQYPLGFWWIVFTIHVISPIKEELSNIFLSFSQKVSPGTQHRQRKVQVAPLVM